MAIDARVPQSELARELACVSDARVVSHINKLLITPKKISLAWDYGESGQQFPAWKVLNDPKSGSAIAYCEFSFGPKCPWGLIGSADDKVQNMGHDSGWFARFLDAFFDSGASIPLPVWRVFEGTPGATAVPITSEGDWSKMWEQVDELRSGDPGGKYFVHHSILY